MQQLKHCTVCLNDKPVEEFSLAKGKSSTVRKSMCTDCELKMRKAKKLNMSLQELIAKLNKPCSICQKPVTHPEDMTCDECHRYIQYVGNQTDPENTLLAAYNYFTIKRQYPFMLK